MQCSCKLLKFRFLGAFIKIPFFGEHLAVAKVSAFSLLEEACPGNRLPNRNFDWCSRDFRQHVREPRIVRGSSVLYCIGPALNCVWITLCVLQKMPH